MTDFNPKKIQKKWIDRWKRNEIFTAKPDDRKKFYLTVAYPYPSGSMHVGHGRTYTVPDVIARYKRMQGYNVLFPMAWHVTGSPVLGIAERIKANDPKTMHIYGKLYNVPKNQLLSFTNPLNIVKHFSKEYKENMTKLGFSIDWSREFLTITPQYSKFITWQYLSLRKKGLIKKGEHAVRYCPRCDNPVGDHDLLEGENSTINEFVVIKFRMDDTILPAATLRPETIFGVTNMWLNPSVTYVRASIDNEIWLISKEALNKLKQIGRNVKLIDEINGDKLIGKECTNPLNNEKIPVLPADFVDPDYATGVVMSVPGHAPYDYVALRDTGSNIKPIKIIEIDKDNREIPAKEIVEKMNIKNQRDKRLDEATEILYRREYSKGIMVKSIEKYGGLRVDRAREKITEDLLKSGNADKFFEFSEGPVICRCGSRCVIRVIKDQWFLNYDNKKWKEKANRCVSKMQIIPREIRQNFEYFIDWLKNWACTRKVGLGTRLPWDEKWIIEPLSDSTIYMAYYTISNYLRDIDPERITPEFFDYVFLGKGDGERISKKLKISQEKLEQIRREFDYWYPPEWRLSAKDLVGNHLTFHIFHHTALFPEEKWPKGIVVFGMGLLEGEKMSSSKGNIVLLDDAIENYGSDVVRLFLMSNAEPWQDFDWRDELVKNTTKKLKQFYDQITYCINIKNNIPERDIDKWLISKMNEVIKNTIESIEAFQIRKALQYAFFEMMKCMNWYFRRCEPRAETVNIVAENWIRLMAPFTPFICEELWELTGNNDMVSVAKYPKPEMDKINKRVIEGEDIIKKLIDDIHSIIDATKKQPNEIHIYLAPEWKRKLFMEIKNGKDIHEIMENPEFKRHGKEAAMIIKNVRRDEIPDEIFSIDEEFKILNDAKDFIQNEFNSKINIYKDIYTEIYDPKNKAKFAEPMRAGIYIE